MKRILVAIFLLSITQILLAQREGNIGFAIIDDKDGFTNIRLKPNSKSKVIGKIKDGELFYCLSNDTKNEWIPIGFNDTLSGYIHKSRVKFLETFPKIKNKKGIKDTLSFKNDSVVVKIIAGDFMVKNHKIVKDKGFVSKIDGKKPYGVDGGLPNSIIKSIQIKIGEDNIEISKNELNDLFQPSFVTPEVYIGQNNTIYLTMSNSDGAGAYELGFVIKDRSFFKRYIYIRF